MNRKRSRNEKQDDDFDGEAADSSLAKSESFSNANGVGAAAAVGGSGAGGSLSSAAAALLLGAGGDATNSLTATEEDENAVKYHCDYCRKDISRGVRIKCAECTDFDLCVECFSGKKTPIAADEIFVRFLFTILSVCLSVCFCLLR
jgi:hypothetical protein